MQTSLNAIANAYHIRMWSVHTDTLYKGGLTTLHNNKSYPSQLALYSLSARCPSSKSFLLDFPLKAFLCYLPLESFLYFH
jgi:hypothetical protein